MNKPDFIGIGAARSGTTWLFRQMEQHPDIWLPRIKELHYFSRSNGYFGPSHLSNEGNIPRILGFDSSSKKYRSMLARALGSNLIKPSIKKLQWDFDYFFRNPSPDWYTNLFAPSGNLTCGEITPQYSVLTPWDIQRLKDQIPQVKIVFIMRDPVERAWSLIKYHEKRGKSDLTRIPIDRLIEEAFHPAKVMQSDYQQILNNWRRVFPASQFFTCFYDQIISEPEKLTNDLCDFLEVARPNQKTIGDHINASSDKEFPAPLKERLVNFYREPIERLNQSEGGYFSFWLERYDQM